MRSIAAVLQLSDLTSCKGPKHVFDEYITREKRLGSMQWDTIWISMFHWRGHLRYHAYLISFRIPLSKTRAASSQKECSSEARIWFFAWFYFYSFCLLLAWKVNAHLLGKSVRASVSRHRKTRNTNSRASVAQAVVPSCAINGRGPLHRLKRCGSVAPAQELLPDGPAHEYFVFLFIFFFIFCVFFSFFLFKIWIF
jgi:hypothetical protein